MVSCQWCAYATADRGNMSKHRRLCRQRPIAPDPDIERLRAEVGAINEELRLAREQLVNKEAQLLELLARNATLEELLSKQLLEVSYELKQTKKRKDRYAEATATRRPRTEPERRKIAQGQGWKCANPDAMCLLPGELQEYDLDHVIPMWKGGRDEAENLQALCPACHRRKTNRERVERSAGVHELVCQDASVHPAVDGV